MRISIAVAIRIKEILDKKGMKRAKLQLNSGIPRGTLNCLMQGKYKGVNLTTLVCIIRTLGISIDEFFKSPIFEDGALDGD